MDIYSTFKLHMQDKSSDIVFFTLQSFLFRRINFSKQTFLSHMSISNVGYKLLNNKNLLYKYFFVIG